MSLLDRLLVPEAKSPCSIRQTFIPRLAASRAVPAPVMPPPITQRSKVSEAIASRARPRSTDEKPGNGLNISDIGLQFVRKTPRVPGGFFKSGASKITAWHLLLETGRKWACGNRGFIPLL